MMLLLLTRLVSVRMLLIVVAVGCEAVVEIEVVVEKGVGQK